MNRHQPYVVGLHVDAPQPPARRAFFWLRVLLFAIAVAAGAIGASVTRADEGDDTRYQPTSRGGYEAVERWRPLLDQYEWDTDTALLVVYCESRGDAGATNPTSGAAGLFQLLGWDRFAARLFGRWVSLYDPAVNTRVAYALYVDSGERFGFHWAASRGCWGGGW